MISTDFAPNEQLDDALLSLKLVFQPWRWIKGKEIKLVKKAILSLFPLTLNTSPLTVSLFLSGRSGLYHLIKSFNLPKNSRVIVQAFTCEAVVLPIIANGLKPIYVDIEKETLSMDINDLKNKMDVGAERALPLQRIIIIQHTFGMTPKYRNDILNFARENKLTVIEDLAHGFNPEIFNNTKYEIRYLLLSFGRSKPFSSVFGGAIVSLDKKFDFKLEQPSYSLTLNLLLYKPIAYLIKSTYNIYIGKLFHKIANSLNLLSKEISDKEKRGEYDAFLDKAYPNTLAILLLHQLKKYKLMQNQRLRISNLYRQQLKNVSYHMSHVTSPLLRYPVLIKNRDMLIKRARRQGIFLGLWYNHVVAPKEIDLSKIYYHKGSCPVAESFCDKIVNLPTLINEKEAKQIIQILNSPL